jgi:subtilisin-like proprotein convertase family protein
MYAETILHRPRLLLGALLAVAALPSAAQVIHTYDDVPGAAIAIADNDCANPLVRSFVVGDSYPVGNVALGLEVTHPWRSDVVVTLTAPDSSVVTLIDGVANDGQDNYRVMLSTNAEGAINDGDIDPAANANYRRLVSVPALAGFYTGSSAGTWELRICDDAAADLGSYERARLVLRDDTTTLTAACGASLSYDWGANGNGNPFTSTSLNGITISQGATSGEAPTDSGSGLPSFVTRTGTLGAHAGYYVLGMDTSGDTERSAEATVFTFSEPVLGLTFDLLDVDTGTFEDYVRIDALDSGGGLVPKQAALQGTLALAGDWTEADNNVGAASTNGNVSYTFDGPVASIRVQYAQGDQPQSNSQFQNIGISDFSFCALDYGDAPAGYVTTFAAGGARHGLGDRSLYLGTRPDGEADGVPDVAANSDGADEDAVTLPTLVSLPTPHFECGSYAAAIDEFCVSVAVVNGAATAAQLVGWFDANGDGDFNDADERSRAALGNGSGGAGDATFSTGNIPAASSGSVVLVWGGMTAITQNDTYLRLRLTSDAAFFSDAPPPPSTGLVSDGEVEDHRVPAGTLPVTLSHLSSRVVGDGVHVQFETASETGNVGFRLVERAGGRELPLHAVPVASERVDSAEVSRYALTLTAVPASGSFYVVDLEVTGRRTAHGPFQVGRDYGAPAASAGFDWTATRAALAELAQLRQTAGSGGTVRLWVQQPGFQRVTHAMLMAAGVDLRGVAVDQIGLAFRGQPVPRRAHASGATFSADSSIDFPVEPAYSLYTKEFPYLLRTDGVGVVDIPQDTLLATDATDAWYWAESEYAPDARYTFASPTDDPWYAERVLAYANQPAQFSRTLSVSAPISVDGVGPELEVDLIGATNWPGSTPDHRVELRVDGVAVASKEFDGLRAQTLTAKTPVPASGSMPIELRVTGDTGFDYDLVYIDRIALRYPRQMVAEAGVLAVSALHAAGDAWAENAGDDNAGESLLASSFEGQDQIPGFVSAGLGSGALGYADTGHGWRALSAVNTAGGPMWPAAAGAHYWLGEPTALAAPRVDTLVEVAPLLQGQADYLVITHALFEPYLAPLVARQQARGLSVRVVDVAQVYAQFNDHVPEAEAIQRFIDKAVAQLGAQYVLLVGADSYDYKNFLGTGSVSLVPTRYGAYGDIVRYAPADGLYVDRDEDGAPEAAIGRLPVRSVVELQSLLAKLVAAAAPKRALLVSPADESDAPFRAVHEGFAARWPAGWTLDRAYVDDLGLDSTRAALGNALNQRLGVLSFVGHSAPTTWSFDPVLSTADLVGRTGLADLVVQWGCWNSYFVAPTANTLAHGFLLTPGSGAAAVIGVTSLTDLKSHEALGNLLHPELAAGARIGDALRLAKMQLAAQGERYRDILIAATLLGDPAQPVP